MSTLKFNNWQKTNGTTVGTVLQVVQGVLATTFTTTSTSWVDITNLTATITPAATSSKILIIAHVQVGGDGSSYDNGIALLRNGTHIALPTSYGSRTACWMPLCQRGQSTYETSTVSNMYLDSPSSTSALTYKLQAIAVNGTTQYINRSSADANHIQDSRHISTITLMEIAG